MSVLLFYFPVVNEVRQLIDQPLERLLQSKNVRLVKALNDGCQPIIELGASLLILLHGWLYLKGESTSDSKHLSHVLRGVSIADDVSHFLKDLRTDNEVLALS